MLTDEIGSQLHDKATRGKNLTSEEHKLLLDYQVFKL